MMSEFQYRKTCAVHIYTPTYTLGYKGTPTEGDDPGRAGCAARPRCRAPGGGGAAAEGSAPSP
eukprot:11494464-Alexandrium_andersonii.AAC.1